MFIYATAHRMMVAEEEEEEEERKPRQVQISMYCIQK